MTTIPSDALYDVMRTACAIRRFRPDPVPDAALSRCLEAATWAPSGSNSQPWRFCVLTSPDARALLGAAYRKGWAELDAATGIASWAAEDSRRGRAARAMVDFVERFEEIPLYVLFCFRDHRDDGPRRSSYQSPEYMVAGSIFPAIQNFLLAARAEGLGTVVTSWFRYVEPELRSLVGVPDGWHMAAVVPVGYPRGRHVPVRRRPLVEVACIDRWDEPFGAGS